MSENRVAHIVIRLSALGDLVLTTGFLQKLAKEKPDEPVIYVTSPQFKGLIEDSFPMKVHFFGVRRGKLKILSYILQGFSLFQAARGLGAKEIRVYDLHSVVKSFLLCGGLRLAALFHRFPLSTLRVSKKRWERWRLLFRKKTSDATNFHVYRISQDLLTLKQNFLPQLRETRQTPQIFSVLLAVDAQHWKKIWPREHWLELIETLGRWPTDSVRVTLVGRASSFDHETLSALNKLPFIRNRIGDTKISELAKIAAQHHVCVCGNTAWQHIAESVGTPVVSLLGPLHSGFGFSPFLSESRELSMDLPCRPCTLHGDGPCHLSGENRHACMKGILPENVLAHLEEFSRRRKELT